MKRNFYLVNLIAILFLFDNLVVAQKSLYTFPFGIQTYTFRRSISVDPAKVLDTIKMLGFTEIEGGSPGMHPGVFKKRCDERGITIPSTGAGYDELVNKIDSVVWRAKILG